MHAEAAMTLTGAFAAGLAASVHCAGMCGPLACLACSRRTACGTTPPAAAYHATRLLAYAVCGAGAAAFGAAALQWLPEWLRASIPWVVLAMVILWALGLTGPLQARMPRLPWLKPNPVLIGAATPLIPCGPLYLMLGLAALSGTAVRGASLLLAFGLGTVPLLWLAQHQWGRLQRWLGPGRALWLQRGLVLAMTVLVAWRYQSVLTGGAATCPACALP